MKFQKYNSIENSYREKFLKVAAREGKLDGNWVVEEKIHGANMGIYCNGKDVRFASRNQMTSPDGFYSLNKIEEELAGYAQECFNRVGGDHIIVYGEIFGGGYPHPDVPTASVSMVQKGVFYSPDIHFYAFDLVRVENGNDEYLPVSAAKMHMRDAGFMTADTLFTGTLQECLEYPNDGESTIPALLGLPVVEDNVMEGVVIKPIKARFLGCGSRVILKNKNEKFAERKSAGKKPKVPVQLDGVVKEMLEQAADYVTENRFDAVVSKMGPMDRKLIGKYIGAMAQDVLKDFRLDVNISVLSDDEYKAFKKQLPNLVKPLILQKVL